MEIRTLSLVLGEENKVKLKEDLESLEIQKGEEAKKISQLVKAQNEIHLELQNFNKQNKAEENSDLRN